MNRMWRINNLKALPLLWQIGFRNGLKSGDRPNDREMIEVYLRHPNWITPIGYTELNREEWVRELASHGKKVLVIKNKDN